MSTERRRKKIEIPEGIGQQAYAIFDPGTVSAGGQEDRYGYRIFQDKGVFVTGDGVSPPYTGAIPGWEKKSHEGRSYGQWAAQCISDGLDIIFEEDTIGHVVEVINDLVRDFHLARNVDVTDPANLGGFTVAAAKVNADWISLATAGDCIAAWMDRDGNIHNSTNQTRASDTLLNALLGQLKSVMLLEQQALEAFSLEALPEAIRERSIDHVLSLDDVSVEFLNKYVTPLNFKYFIETLAKVRRLVWNRPGLRGYGIVNGDPRVMELLQQHTLRKSEVKTLILCSDGFYTRAVYESPDPKAIGDFLFTHYQRGGLEAIRDAVDATCLADAKTSYGTGDSKTNEPEGCAIAIEF